MCEHTYMCMYVCLFVCLSLCMCVCLYLTRGTSELGTTLNWLQRNAELTKKNGEDDDARSISSCIMFRGKGYCVT